MKYKQNSFCILTCVPQNHKESANAVITCVESVKLIDIKRETACKIVNFEFTTEPTSSKRTSSKSAHPGATTPLIELW